MGNRDSKTLTLIRPRYFSIRLILPDGRITRSQLLWGNPLVLFPEPFSITLGHVSGGGISTRSSCQNSASTSGQKQPDSDSRPSASDLPYSLRTPETAGFDWEEGTEEDRVFMALHNALDRPEGELAMYQVCVNLEDARYLPRRNGEIVLPLEVDMRQKPYRVQWPVPVYTEKGKPWNKLDRIQKAFEEELEEYDRVYSKQRSQVSPKHGSSSDASSA